MIKKPIDWILLTLYILLSLFGLIMVYSASSFRLLTQESSPFDLFNKQALFIIIGFLFVTVLSQLNANLIVSRKLPSILVITALLLLVMVKIPGIGVNINGAQRWLSIAGIQIQPADFSMLAIIFYLGHYYRLSNNRKSYKYPIMISFIFSLLIITQPKVTGALMILGLTFTIVLINSVPLKQVALTAGISLPITFLLSKGLLFLGNHQALPKLFHHVYLRLLTVSDPFSDYYGNGYQMSQSYIALYNGGFTGQGLGNSITKKGFLPVTETDFIFSIIVEELGLIIGFIVLAFLFGLCIRLFYLASKIENQQKGLLLLGMGLLLFSQITINIASVSGIIPMTGIPLPFISYGGTNFIVNSIMIGVALNICRSDC